MTDEERALLVASLLMDYPHVTYAVVVSTVDAASDAVSVVRPHDRMAEVEQIARTNLGAPRRRG